MMKYKKAKQMAVPSQNVEIDPRSKTTADGAFNNIPNVIGSIAMSYSISICNLSKVNAFVLLAVAISTSNFFA